MKVRVTIRVAALCFVLAALPALRAGVVLFDFDAAPDGTSTTFSETVGGLTARFSSPGDPGGFMIGPTFFSTLTGNVLLDPGPAGLNRLVLQIDFDVPIVAISMLFATNSSFSVPLLLTAYNQGVLVASTSASGTFFPGFFFPEGTLSLGGAVFNRVVLSTSALDFAIDNLAATPTPEPAGFLVAIAGLVLIGFARRLPGSRD